MTERFVDTSVLLSYLLQRDQNHTERTIALFEAVFTGGQRIHLEITVIFEAIHVLHKRFQIPRSPIAQQLAPLLGCEFVMLPDKADILETLVLWEQQSPLSFADCYHLVRTRSLGLTEIYSFDKKMDRYPGVTRVEP
jgi:predicted nucleic acid-binding protein